MERRRIQELRKGLGLSQERFAQLLSVSLQTVRRWESGLSRPLPIISLKLEELRREAAATHEEGGEVMGTKARTGEARVEVGLGGLLKGMGNLLALVGKMTEEEREGVSRTGTVEALGGKLRGVYGFSVRVGLEGKPVIQQFGNIRETEAGPVVAAAREPLVDVIEEADRVVVIVELPGVEEKDVQVKVEGDILEVTAASGDRKYQNEVVLPFPVTPETLQSSYRNGVLEIRLARR